MASSGSYNTSGGYAGRVLNLSWNVKSTDVANNRTTISYTLKGTGGDTSKWYMTGPVNVWIDGNSVYSSSNRFQLKSGTVVTSGTYTFQHNADGNRNMRITVKAAIYSSAVNSEGTQLWALPQIARASSFEISGGYLIGRAHTFTISRASSSFTHTLRYQWAGASGTIASNVATSYTWTIPSSFADKIPAASSGALNIYCDTYSGSTKIGTTSSTMYVNVPNTVEFTPTVSSVTLSEAVSGLAAKFGGFVKTKSKISGAVAAAGAHGSTIKSYSISINDERFSSSTFTTGILTGSGTCNVTVTDSRGRTATKQVTYTCLDYFDPKIEQFKVIRVNSVGEPDNAGAYVAISYNVKFAAVSNKNKATVLIKKKKTSDSGYTTTDTLNDKFEYVGTVKKSDIDIDSEYDFQVEACDFFHSVGISKTVHISSGFSLINYNTSGTAMAFGGVSKRDIGVELQMPTYDAYDTLFTNGMALSTESNEAVDLNPDTTVENLILTDIETPTGMPMYISTVFYGDKTPTSNRAQTATPYYQIGSLYHRQYFNGMWGAWEKMMVDNGRKLLWSGRLQMNASQTVTLSEPISIQTNGIVLVFTGTGGDWYYNSHFVSKYLIADKGTVDIFFTSMVAHKANCNMSKYLNISDTVISGTENNAITVTTDNIKYSNNQYALSYVYGV